MQQEQNDIDENLSAKDINDLIDDLDNRSYVAGDTEYINDRIREFETFKFLSLSHIHKILVKKINNSNPMIMLNIYTN